VTASHAALARRSRAAASIGLDIPITGATPKVTHTEPWQERE
jgi:hypothetical protein